jgi:aspartyl-tRNA(Asn)/glutamyl-tRNA(Gln) amidotransferase subunit A
MTDLTDLSIRQMHDGYVRGDFSPVDAADAFLARIDEQNPGLNAYLEVFDDVRASAEEAAARIKKEGASAPLLAGIPLAIKDNILIKGKRVSAASRMLENYTATYDATVVAKLKEQGALFLGRTNMDEFAMGSSTENSSFSPSKNPHDITRVPGGSSGGSAAAAAARLCAAALGSDTGGSIRQPASFCGLYGLKPTYGRVSRSGLIAMGSSLDQIGPLTRTLDDTVALYEATKGRDPLDSTTIPDANEEFSGEKLVVGVPRAFVEQEGVDTDVRECFNAALETLAQNGHEIVDIDLPLAPKALGMYYIIMPAEVSTNLARLDGVRYGLHVNGENLMDDYKKSRGAGFGKETRRRILIGTYVLSAGYYDAYYRAARKARAALSRDYARALERVSVIATPTSPTPAFKIGEKSDPLSMYLADIFTVPPNLTGMPALSAPMGTVAREGKELPVGIQFTAAHRAEAMLFAAARELATSH